MNLKKKKSEEGEEDNHHHIQKKKNDYFIFTFPCTKYRCIVKNINFKKKIRRERGQSHSKNLFIFLQLKITKDV